MKRLLTFLAITVCLGLISTPVFAANEFMLSTSQHLTGAAWAAFTGTTYNTGAGRDMTFSEIDYSGGESYTDAKKWADICIFFWESYALDPLTKPTAFMTTGTVTQLYTARWAYSDVATCIFIKAESLLDRSVTPKVNTPESIAEYKKLCEWESVHGDYEYAQIAKDLAGPPAIDPDTASIATYTWRVAVIARLRLNNWMDSGDPETLIVAAWDALDDKDFQTAATRAQDVIDNFDEFVSATNKTKAGDFYTTPGSDTIANLFDLDSGAGVYSHLATAHFIKGEANRRGWASGGWGDKTAAILAYQEVEEGGSGDYPSGLCANAILYKTDGVTVTTDPTEAPININTWKVSEAAKKRLALGGGTSHWDDADVKAMLQY